MRFRSEEIPGRRMTSSVSRHQCRMASIVAIVVALAAPVDASGQQDRIDNYESARDNHFWPQLYRSGGESLYCVHAFGREQRQSDRGEALSVEHAYPAEWIAQSLGCEGRDDCDHPLYGFAEADLHNLWPALGRINSSRQDLAFGPIPGESRRRFEDICPDYERTSGADAIVEPRDSVKGDIARSMLYMILTYDLSTYGLGPMLMRWHRDDPPDENERARNYLIDQIQGTSNPLIEARW